MKRIRTKLVGLDVINILSKIPIHTRVLLAKDEEYNEIYSNIYFDYQKEDNTVIIFGWGNAEEETIKELRDQKGLPIQTINNKD